MEMLRLRLIGVIMSDSINSGDNCINIISSGDVSFNINLSDFTEEFRLFIAKEIKGVLSSGSNREVDILRSIGEGDKISAENALKSIMFKETEDYIESMLRKSAIYSLIDKDKSLFKFEEVYSLFPNNFDAFNCYILALIDVGQLDRAELVIRNGMEIFEDDEEIEVINGNLGVVLKNQGKFLDAIGCFIIAAEKSEKKCNYVGTVKHLNNLGNCYNHQGEYDESMSVLETALDYLRGNFIDMVSKEVKLLESNILTNMAISCKNKYQFSKENELLIKAKEFLLKAISVVSYYNIPQVEGRHYGNIANIYESLGEKENYIDSLKKAKSCFERTSSDKDYITCEINIGRYYYSINELNFALEHYNKCFEHKSLALYKPIHALLNYNVACVYHAKMQMSKATGYALDAYHIYMSIGRRDMAKRVKEDFALNIT